MPPFKGSRDAHEQVNATYVDAESSLEDVQLAQERHVALNRTALGIMREYGVYSDQTPLVATPWVYNPSLEDGETKTAYQLRASNAHVEGEDFGEISLVVRVSRPNPINPNALITYEEVRARINSPVFFTEGDIEHDTYVQRQGLGLESDRPSSAYVRTLLPVEAQPAETEKFADTVETLFLIEQAFES